MEAGPSTSTNAISTNVPSSGSSLNPGANAGTSTSASTSMNINSDAATSSSSTSLEGDARQAVQEHLASRWRRNQSSLTLPDAAQPEIIWAFQKNAYYAADVREQVEEVARSIMGTRWLQTWSKELGVASGFAMHSIMSVAGLQSLGEEYVDIIPYWSKNKKIASKRRRLVWVTLQILGPYAFEHVYAQIRRRWNARVTARRNEHEDHQDTNNESIVILDHDSNNNSIAINSTTDKALTSRFKQKWNSLINLIKDTELPALDSVLEDYIRAVHLTAFYLWGRYYSVANRLTGIRYVSSSRRENGAEPPSYEVLGVLMAIQLIARAIKTLARYRRRYVDSSATNSQEQQQGQLKGQEGEKSAKTNKQGPVVAARACTVDGRELGEMTFDPEADEAIVEEDDDENQRRRCTLCLGPQRDSTVTECGHVFCWECIVGWARARYECPLCRQAVTLARLIPLYNY